MRAWLIVLLCACSAGAPGPGIDVDRAMQVMKVIADDGPRPGDSVAAHHVLELLESELARAGITYEEFSVGSIELPEITVLGVRHRDAHRVDTSDPDLLVRFGPPGKALLVMAHYDSVPASPGAVDNAAAVGVLLELARVLHEHPPAQPVLLAFTANEEIGLVGAEALAERRGDEIAFAIALDLIGGSGALTLNGASELIGLSEMRWLAAAADRAGVVISAPPPHRVISRWWPQAERSDHGPFTRRGIRAVHFYDRGQDGERIDLAYHGARDIAGRVHREAVAEIGRLLRALADTPPPPHDGDGFWLPVARNTVIPRWLLLALELALVLVALIALVITRDGLVAMVARPRREPLLRGAGVLAAVACWVAAVGVAIGLEGLVGYPGAWLHAPLRSEIGEALVIAGALGLATRLVARVAPWTGRRRYLALAVLVPVMIGIVLVAIGAAELAWIWLVPAAALALTPRLGVAAALLPLVLVLAPSQLREAAWNGFLPASLPLAAWLGVLAIPVLSGVAARLRARACPGPLGTLVLPVGCGLAVVIGSVIVTQAHSPCKQVEFMRFNLGCEASSPWP